MKFAEIQEITEQWIAHDPDPETAAELRELLARDDEAARAELASRMERPLAFGTAGLRGVVGAGRHRMNRAVILRTSAGLAAHLLAAVEGAAERGVVVGYDGRTTSEAFARDAASVFAGAGLRAHLFDHVVPTPLLAYAVTALNAAAGVMVTASHNPPEYNGYKVYWAGGAQIIPPIDLSIAAAIAASPPADEVPTLAAGEAESRGLLQRVPEAIERQYLDGVAALSFDRRGRDLTRIVYTAMHGVGDPWTRAALERFGFEQVWSVPEQQHPDGTFPTVRFPNPEEPGALDLALDLARARDATLVLANDPDADRLAVAIPTAAGGWRQLNGNEVGLLLADYLLRVTADRGEGRLVGTTIVSSPGLHAIAAAAKVRSYETLTGFKWIAARARELEESEGLTFLFGYEEALGYTIGTLVRDKDGVSAAAVFAELTAVAAARGRTLEDELERIARERGLFLSDQRSFRFEGPEGAARIASIMTGLRENPPQRVAGARVTERRDYEKGEAVADGEVSRITMPRGNVIAFDLEGGGRVVARPSGTEPKIKLYFDLCERVGGDEPFAEARRRAEARLAEVIDGFLAFLDL